MRLGAPSLPPRPSAATPTLETVERLVSGAGLGVRGAFDPDPQDGVPPVAPGRPARTLVLLGWTGRSGFDGFSQSTEARDGAPHPLDRWSRRRIDALAETLGALALYPFGGPPHHPFQRWALRAEPAHPSPLGLLIHPRHGLWHSYRGALAFSERLESVSQPMEPSPCRSCDARPCLSACPVGAFTASGYDVDACASHLRSPEGGECMQRGCLARRACPVGREHAYGEAQQSFLMAAFLAAR